MLIFDINSNEKVIGWEIFAKKKKKVKTIHT